MCCVHTLPLSTQDVRVESWFCPGSRITPPLHRFRFIGLIRAELSAPHQGVTQKNPQKTVCLGLQRETEVELQHDEHMVGGFLSTRLSN